MTIVDPRPSFLRLVIERPATSIPPGSGEVEPITIGVPMPRGLCRDDGVLRLSGGGRTDLPAQTRVLDRWPDGSIRWVLIDFQHTWSTAAPDYLIDWSASNERESASILTVVESADGIEIGTGAAQFRIRRGGGFPFDFVSVNETAGVRPETRIEAVAHSPLVAVVGAAHVEERGALRVVVAVSATAVSGGHPLELTAELHFFAGMSTVRAVMTLRNPGRAKHPRGFWELGDSGSAMIRDASVSFAHAQPAGPAHVRCSPEPGLAFASSSSSVEVYQDSSGGANWASANHVNRDGRVPNRFCGYQIIDDRGTSAGRRATPWVIASREAAWIGVTSPRFWQNAPKALEANTDGVTLRLFPKQFGDVHELQGGEQKTHEFYFTVSPGAPPAAALEWCRQPSRARCEPQWYCGTLVNPYLTPAADDPHGTYLALVNAAIEGPDSFEQKREAIDEYGWRHYGDLYADHEAAFHKGPTPLVSHYNNQYDAIAGVAYQFMRSGDLRWWHAMQDLACHVIDIDIYHTTADKAAYNGGLFWHTCHYTDAGRSTHRSYPRSTSIGGGPASEHNYATGLMLYHFLTGQAQAREAAIGLARWVVAMDDGSQSPFRWLAAGDTGLASVTNGVQGPGRGGANSVTALLDGFRLTGDRALLEKAERLICRCIHPDDDLAPGQLLDRELRWSYVVFLQALGRYLDEKRDLGEIDRMYAYAAASLLAYARWMAAHEFPYLDKPEMLEFPNETWAAQDMRKSEVFKFAAVYATGAERERFLERSRFFFDYSTATLAASPHHARTRPLVLMLQYGYSHAHFQRSPPSFDPGPVTAAMPSPEPFVPQKVVAKRRLIAAAALLGVLALVVTFAIAVGWR